MAATDTRTITATIARVNGRGFTTREQPNTWLNLSRYAKPAPIIPPTDTEVRLTIDGDGYVRAIEPVLSAHEETPASADHHAMASTKDAAIVRLAALKAAVRLTPASSDPKPTLALAATFEAWITR